METKKFDLELRCKNFAIAVRSKARNIKMKIDIFDDVKQVIRSSGSIGANYIEANQSLSKADFVNRIKIARKEARETSYWLELIANSTGEDLFTLIEEAKQLEKILGAIRSKFEKGRKF